MESIIMKGKNKQEAIDKALEKLKTTIENVDIEVIEEAEKRMFGLYVKPTVVKVSKKPAADPVGKAWITNGIVHFEATENEQPQLVPSEGLTLRKNGETVTETVFLQKGDDVRIEGATKEEAGTFEIELDEQKLSARIFVQPGYREEVVPVDCPPVKQLKPKSKRVRRFQETIQAVDILNEMKKQGITYGIDEQAIEQACMMEQPGDVEIAKGLAVKEGKDGFVNFLIDIETHTLKPKERSDGTVDFREVRQIPTVEKGAIIGVIMPPKQGEAGIAVTGETIDPSPVQPVTVKGTGIEVDGERIIAMKTGTPSVHMRQHVTVIDIVEKLIHHRNVNMESGNLSFVGDVEIIGDVEETMRVQANGKVLVHENVVGANVVAGAALVVNKNVIRANLMIGTNDEQSLTLYKQSEQLLQEIKKFHSTLQQLLRAQTQRTIKKNADLTMTVRTLTQQKFANLQKQVTSFVNEVKNDPSRHQEAKRIAHLLSKAFLSFDQTTLKSVTVFADMENELSTLKSFYEMSQKDFASATLASVQQSEIYCNGDVYFTGKGVYNTKVEAEGKVHSLGFVRGGKIYAGEGIFAYKVGSAPGVETILAVPSDKKITMEHVMEDSKIQIGKRIYTFDIERKNVCARLNDEGELLLT